MSHGPAGCGIMTMPVGAVDVPACGSLFATASTVGHLGNSSSSPKLKNSGLTVRRACAAASRYFWDWQLNPRSEEHTSELQSPCNLVCRLLLEKKKQTSRRTMLRTVERPRVPSTRTPQPPSVRAT